jgi:hypothetical protein
MVQARYVRRTSGRLTSAHQSLRRGEAERPTRARATMVAPMLSAMGEFVSEVPRRRASPDSTSPCQRAWSCAQAQTCRVCSARSAAEYASSRLCCGRLMTDSGRRQRSSAVQPPSLRCPEHPSKRTLRSATEGLLRVPQAANAHPSKRVSYSITSSARAGTRARR